MSDERIKRTTDAGREDRAMQDRAVTENRELTDDERLALYAQQFYQSSLPDIPPIPGYHIFWATTTNLRDTPQQRERLGYTPVKPSDIGGWDYATLKTGTYEGCVGVNEMIAMKIPERLWQKFMMKSHHEMPLEQEAGITELAESLRDKRSPMRLEGEGLEEMRDSAARKKAPVFT